MTEQNLPPPPVMWAQRYPVVILTINLEDTKDPEIKFTKDSVYIKVVGGLDKKCYEVTIPLYGEIDPEKSRYFTRGRFIEMLLDKAKHDAPFWPALTSDKKKHHWIKCDFNKWQDEDDTDDEKMEGGGGGGGDKNSWEDMMRQLGGLGGAGGMDGKPGLGDLPLEGEEDSDDEQIPELE